MKKNLLILIALIFSCKNLPLRSQAGPPIQKYSLASLVDQVLDQSPLLDSFQSRLEEKRFLSGQSAAWPNPEGSFSVGQKNAESQDGSVYEAALSQTFLVPGKLKSRVLLADTDVELARISQLEAGLMLVSEAVRLAYDYEVNRKRKQFAQRRFERFDLVRAYLSTGW